jgi:hypothetical protein
MPFHHFTRCVVAGSRRVATQLSRDRRRVTTDAAGNLTHPNILSVKNRDLFVLRE